MLLQPLINEARKIRDPRRQYGNLRHQLVSIVVIAFCAIIAKAEDYEDIEAFGVHHRKWLEGFLELPNGIPDQDTFRRLLERLDPGELARCLYGWLAASRGGGQLVNIDGKTIRGSGNGKHAAYHVISAWVGETHITLGELAVEEKSNEIPAIPRLLDLIDIEGCTVTLDAMGCQKEIARRIEQKKARYCLALKANQGTLYESAKLYLDTLPAAQTATTHDKGHGRIETRQYSLETDIDWLPGKADWKGLKAIGAVKSTVQREGRTVVETRYYLTSLQTVDAFAAAVRGHWAIENQLHWRLDVTFGEDAARQRKDNSPLN